MALIHAIRGCAAAPASPPGWGVTRRTSRKIIPWKDSLRNSAAALALFFASLLSSAQASDAILRSEPIEQGFKTVLTMSSMGTKMRITLTGTSKAALEKFASSLADEIRHHDAIFTVHRPGPMADVNRHAGEWTEVPCMAAVVVADSLRLAEFTGGAFDPTVGRLTDLWKIGFGGRDVPSVAAIDEAKKTVDWKRVSVEQKPGRCRVRIGSDQLLDLGGIVKGWSDTELLTSILHSVVGLSF